MEDRRLVTPPDTSESEASFVPDDPRPRYYIIRPDMTFVPLIAIDEINPMIRIHGVPPSLTHGDIEEWNMARVGDQVERPINYYRVEFSTDSRGASNSIARQTSSGQEKRHAKLQAKDAVAPKDASPQPHDTTVQPSTEAMANDDVAAPGEVPIEAKNENISEDVQSESEESDDILDAVDRVVKETKLAREDHPSKTKNAATPGIYGKKKFCTYWIRTGNCDYVQEGCKYLHVIPDEETRLRIGIRDMPRWAREDVPATQEDFFSKEHPSMSQDWRRNQPSTGRIDELPETNTKPVHPVRQPRAALPPAPPKHRSNAVRVMQPQFPPFNMVELRGDEKANQVAPVNTAAPKLATFSSPAASIPATASSAAESYQRQMEANAVVSPIILPSPTPLAHRYSPSTRTPISRPVNVAYRAPDRMLGEGKGSGPVQSKAFSQATCTTSPWNPSTPFSPPRNLGQHAGTTNSPFGHIQASTPSSSLPPSFGHMSLDTGASPAPSGGNGFGQSHPNKSATQAFSPLGSQSPTFQSTAPVYVSQKLVSKEGNLSPYLRNFKAGPTTTRSALPTGSEAAKRMLNGHLAGNINGTSNKNSVGKNASQLSNAHNSPIEAPVSSGANGLAQTSTVLHRRHFVPPGEAQYVAASVEANAVEQAKDDGKTQGAADKASAKKNGFVGGKKKQLRGRGSDTYN